MQPPLEGPLSLRNLSKMQTRGRGPPPGPALPNAHPTVENNSIVDLQELGKMLAKYHSFFFCGRLWATPRRLEEELNRPQRRMHSQLEGWSLRHNMASSGLTGVVPEGQGEGIVVCGVILVGNL